MALPPEPHKKRPPTFAVVGRDLHFTGRDELEAQFAAEDGSKRSELDWRIALLRACLLPMLAASQRSVGSTTGVMALACLAAGTCIAIPLALRFDRTRYIRYYRSPLLVVLAVAQVVAAHWQAPPPVPEGGATRLQMVIHLVLGNGVFYQHLAHHLSPHLWSWMLAQHVLVLAALVSMNSYMCSSSVTLRAGYAALRALLPRRLLTFLCVALSPSQGLPLSCSSNRSSSWGLEPGEGDHSVHGVASVQMCCHSQLLLQLALGCLLPLWMAYSREARERRRWLQSRGVRPVMAGGCLLDFASFALPVLCTMVSLHAHRLLPAIY